VLEAITPKAALKVEGEDARVDARMLKDERERQKGFDEDIEDRTQTKLG
jgi:hypothetical protein